MTPVVVQVVLPIVSLVITLLFAFLTKVATERMKAGAAKDATLELVAAAEVVVRSIEQTTKPAMVTAAMDGRLTTGDLLQIKQLAMKELKDQLSDQAQKVLKANGTRVEEALSRAIESQVHKQKEAVGVPAPPAG